MNMFFKTYDSLRALLFVSFRLLDDLKNEKKKQCCTLEEPCFDIDLDKCYSRTTQCHTLENGKLLLKSLLYEIYCRSKKFPFYILFIDPVNGWNLRDTRRSGT